MEPDFWLERWQANHIGFHRDGVHDDLRFGWPQLNLHSNSRILVPLCGKSRDMLWLAEQGHAVIGVEISPLAVEQFYSENGLSAQVHETALGRRYVSRHIEILCGDFFRLRPADIGPVTAFYDRAALIALPQAQRAAYTRQLGLLTDACRHGLLITLDYPQQQMDGPPFAVPGSEVDALFSAEFHLEQLRSRDVLAEHERFRERGLTALAETVWKLTRH